MALHLDHLPVISIFFFSYLKTNSSQYSQAYFQKKLTVSRFELACKNELTFSSFLDRTLQLRSLSGLVCDKQDFLKTKCTKEKCNFQLGEMHFMEIAQSMVKRNDPLTVLKGSKPVVTYRLHCFDNIFEAGQKPSFGFERVLDATIYTLIYYYLFLSFLLRPNTIQYNTKFYLPLVVHSPRNGFLFTVDCISPRCI